MANITEIGINTGSLDRDTDSLNNLLSRIGGEAEGMFGAVRVLDTMWDGPANTAFNEQFRGDYESMKDICATVQSLVRCMENASRQYVSGENQVRGIVDSIRI